MEDLELNECDHPQKLPDDLWILDQSAYQGTMLFWKGARGRAGADASLSS